VKAEIHSLNWPGSDPRLAKEQKGIFKHFQLPLTQHHRKLDHSVWIDAVLRQSKADVVLFVDNDCVPLSRSAPMEAIQWAAEHQSFLGLAQASNHINNGIHVFAAPALLAIARSAWMRLGQPSCRPTPRGDVAEELRWRAEEHGLPSKPGTRGISTTPAVKVYGAWATTEATALAASLLTASFTYTRAVLPTTWI